ncbi:MAG: ACT domain-containing protein [Verrucomicrobia bacterium]|nr:ACT domain-containing protein [Verrucomicrobiota bacterium]
MLTLSVMSVSLAVVRLDASSAIPLWATEGKGFFSITKTDDELSVVCSEDNVPQDVKVEKGWKCLKVEGPLDFGLTGILSSLAQPLAEAKISIFAISTFDTDYVMVKKENLQKAIEVLSTFCILSPVEV